MRKFKIIFTLLANTVFIYAQQWHWAFHESADKIAADKQGNIYCLKTKVIKKFNTSGNLQWTKEFTGDIELSAMAPDQTGNLIITGSFSQFFFDSQQFASNGSSDIFLGKISSDGYLVWSKSYGSSGADRSGDVTIMNTGKILTCGTIDDGAVIEGSTLDSSSLAVLRFDADGNLEKSFYLKRGSGWEIACDGNGNSYVLGGVGYLDSIAFGNGTGMIGNGPAGSHFMLKLDNSLNLIWGKDFGGNYYAPHSTLDCDKDGNFFLSHWYRYSGFGIFKFNSNGVETWETHFDQVYAACNSLVTDKNGDIWIAGNLWNAGEVYKQPFVWHIDKNGRLKDSIVESHTAAGISLTYDDNFNFYVSGHFENAQEFGSTTLQASGGKYFIAKFHGDFTNTVSYIVSEGREEEINIYPNPAKDNLIVRIHLPTQSAAVTLYDLSGRCIYSTSGSAVHQIEIPLGERAKGIYLVEVQTKNARITKRIVVE